MKKGIRAIAYMLVVVMLLSYLSYVFLPKEETYNTQRKFYEEERNTLDVLYFGSSSCVRGVSPLRIWEQYGIPSFSRATTLQAPSVTYALFEEALKYQKPQVVVLFCEWLFDDYDYAKNETQVRTAVDSMRLNPSKLKLIMDIKKQDSEQTMSSYVFPIFRYHSRWNQIGVNDFRMRKKPYDDTKGQRPVSGADDTILELSEDAYKARITEEDVLTQHEQKEGWEDKFVEESVDYYQKMIDRCKEENIEVLIVKGPKMNWKSKMYKRQAAFAEKNGAAYIDFNREDIQKEIGFDGKTDYQDKGHVNYEGAIKMSDYIGKYLKENYQLEDKSEFPEYEEWDALVEKYYSVWN